MELGIVDWNWGLKLGIEMVLELRIGIGDWDGGMGWKIGIGDGRL